MKKRKDNNELNSVDLENWIMANKDEADYTLRIMGLKDRD